MELNLLQCEKFRNQRTGRIPQRDLVNWQTRIVKRELTNRNCGDVLYSLYWKVSNTSCVLVRNQTFSLSVCAVVMNTTRRCQCCCQQDHTMSQVQYKLRDLWKPTTEEESINQGRCLSFKQYLKFCTKKTLNQLTQQNSSLVAALQNKRHHHHCLSLPSKTVKNHS